MTYLYVQMGSKKTMDLPSHNSMALGGNKLVQRGQSSSGSKLVIGFFFFLLLSIGSFSFVLLQHLSLIRSETLDERRMLASELERNLELAHSNPNAARAEVVSLTSKLESQQ